MSERGWRFAEIAVLCMFALGLVHVCATECNVHAHAQPALEGAGRIGLGDDIRRSDAATVESSVGSLEREALDLARVCVGEAGFDVAATGECAAIDAVIRSRAEQRRVSWRRALVDYSTAYFRATLRRRRWLFGLNAEGTQPAHWYRSVPWSRFRDRWLETIEHAAAVRRDEVPLPCAEPPHYWGAPYGADLHRARAQGWRRIRCAPEVHNAFWSVR